MGTGSVAPSGKALRETLPPRCLSPFQEMGTGSVAPSGKALRETLPPRCLSPFLAPRVDFT